MKRCREWQGVLAEGGWAGITWPTAFGGRGGRPIDAAIFNQEQARFGVSNGVFAIAIGMVGPTLLAHGTDEQKRPLPAADAPRRRGVVPALQRARGRLRPRQHHHPRRARRRRVGRHRPEGVDVGGAPGRVGHPPRPHRPRRAEAPAASPTSSSTCRQPGHRHPAAAADDRRRALQRGVPRRRPHPAGQRGRRGGGGVAGRPDHPGQRARRHRRGLRRGRPARAHRPRPAARPGRRPARAPGRRGGAPAGRSCCGSCASGPRPRCRRGPGPARRPR